MSSSCSTPPSSWGARGAGDNAAGKDEEEEEKKKKKKKMMIDKCGYLLKQSDRSRGDGSAGVGKRWFVLSKNELSWYVRASVCVHVFTYV